MAVNEAPGRWGDDAAQAGAAGAALRCTADELIAAGPVIPVIVIDDVAHAVPMARALVDGGVRVLEVTLRTPAGLPAIAAIAREVPQAIVGAGTVCSAADAQAAADAGARFAVSPGYLPAIGQACRDAGLLLLPGVATASEVMAARADGHALLKFFPAVPAGGVAMLKAWAGPFADVRFCPTGGLTPETAPQFLALANVPVCGGSWLTPADVMRAGDWARLAALARAASALRKPV
ncbi:MAG: bifunctional 4-hydroxy-2-oxoglutarate aldolase/2-dehydro-3-deoxy-phosphogluconate aldolase [Burkholderiales bacterium]|nr:bifunctional 4-hydroxy-2-oxoglutarate aldolase/2-dehydro-3-deoxy-phosphogluconate aldolase [Burkholderiales bacterium]